MIKKIFFLSFSFSLLLSGGKLCAQNLLDSLSLDTTTAITSLAEAMKAPLKVVKLDLHKQKIGIFPKEILEMKNLQWLDISKNKIDSIPEEIGDLISLQYLNVSKNKLTYLPKSIGNFTHMKKLNASQNSITGIPPTIGGMKDLRILDMWDNELSYFPETLGSLEHLRVLDLRNILIDTEVQKKLIEMMPTVKIFFDTGCNCGG